MRNKNVDSYIKIINFPASRLGSFYRAAMNFIATLLLVPHNLTGELMLSPSNTLHLRSLLFNSPRKPLLSGRNVENWIYWTSTHLILINHVNCMCSFFLLPQYPRLT